MLVKRSPVPALYPCSFRPCYNWSTSQLHTQVDFTYPGTTRQILKEVTIQCSLNSRIAILGPNGAGKSTMVKLLTGELLPDSGVCWKHPNMRVAYVAQHAFHHIENHLDMVRSSLPAVPCNACWDLL